MNARERALDRARGLHGSIISWRCDFSRVTKHTTWACNFHKVFRACCGQVLLSFFLLFRAKISNLWPLYYLSKRLWLYLSSVSRGDIYSRRYARTTPHVATWLQYVIVSISIVRLDTHRHTLTFSISFVRTRSTYYVLAFAHSTSYRASRSHRIASYRIARR